MTPVQIMLVEDQEGDILLTRQVLAEHLIPVKVHAAMDGQQAVSMLTDPSFQPDLIILDWEHQESPAMNCWGNADCGMSQ
jgi:CheY-like chemotaxis protein